MEFIERIRIDCLNDISRANIIYTCLLVATTSAADSLTFLNLAYLLGRIKMSFANTSQRLLFSTDQLMGLLGDYSSSSSSSSLGNEADGGEHNYDGSSGAESGSKKAGLLVRMSTRLGLYLEQLAAYLASQFNEHTVASIASCSVLIIVLTIICCFILSLWREEERRIKEQYARLATGGGSSQSFIALDGRCGRTRQTSCEATQRSSQGSTNACLVSDGGRQSKCAPLVGALFGSKGTFSHFQGNASEVCDDTSDRRRRLYQKIIEQQSSVDSNPTSALDGFGARKTTAPEPPSSSSVTSTTHLLHEHQRQTNDQTSRITDRRERQQPRVETKSQQGQAAIRRKHNHPQHAYTGSRSTDKLRLHELRRETYFGLVRLSRPGCRTVVLLCDAQSRAKLLARFYACVYPYRKNKSIQFAFLLIEHNIGWYEDLLKSVLGGRCPGGFRINPINCIGTVLVLNGFKKSFSVYHASNSRWSSPTADEEPPPSLLLEEDLLDNLSEWLERALAGKVSRYFVDAWPDRVQHLY